MTKGAENAGADHGRGCRDDAMYAAQRGTLSDLSPFVSKTRDSSPMGKESRCSCPAGGRARMNEPSEQRGAEKTFSLITRVCRKKAHRQQLRKQV